MDISVIVLQVVTILVSITSLVVNFISTMQENKKKNYIKIVTEQRLKNKTIVRDNVATLLSYAGEYYFSNFDKEYFRDCCKCASNIETVLKRFYKEDIALLNSVENLLQAFKVLLETGDSTNVESERKNLLYEFSLYDLADWQFIKVQSSGSTYDSDDFDDIYSKLKNKYPQK